VAEEPLATLIGDLVGSRRHDDRRALQAALAAGLARANEALRPVQPLEPTIGDEFQGAFAGVAAAARASLVVRLVLLVGTPEVDSRYGLGLGDVAVFDAQRRPLSQDGPAWWAAREAIDAVKASSGTPRTAFARTGYQPAPGAAAPADAAALNAFLLCRDATVGQMNARQRRLLLGLLLERSQADLAAGEGITQSAVSQNLHRSGAYAVEAGHLRLEGTAA